MNPERKTDPLEIGGANCRHPFWFELRIIKVVIRKFGPVAIARCMNCNKEIEMGWLSSEYANE